MRAWLKGLTIIIILFSPFLSDSGFLTAQEKKHKTAQLVCQAPPRDATTGKLIDADNPIFRDTFSPREKVQVAQKPDCDCEIEETSKSSVWVRLESISFNHTPESGSHDAIDIRHNWKKDVRVPEWKKGKDPYPAAYIKNRNVTIKAVFSASTNFDLINIGACRCSGKLGDVIEQEVNFRKRCIFKNSKLGSEHFQINLPTPDKVTSFYQEWRWYFIHNGVRHNIGKSGNKIYIVLAHPQSPWKTKGRSKPWAEALDRSCTWAHGENTPEGAASKITHQLYHHVGGEYACDGSDDNQFIEGSKTGGFYLGTFLRSIPDVGCVNCAVMGKALVTLANILGCGTYYKEIGCIQNGERSYRLNPIKSIGWEWDSLCTPSSIGFHAFGSIGENIFDATFYYVCDSNCPVDKVYPVHIMENIPWEEYKMRLIKEPISEYPETFCFTLIRKKY